MAAAPAPRRRPGAVPMTALAALAGLAVLIALATLAFGRAAPGGLLDQGPAGTITPPLEAQPLWPQLSGAPSPTATATATAAGAAQEPQPVPDLTVPGHDITAVDVRAVLARDPKVSPEERQALGSCAGCEVRAPEFRDLTGDGRPELITVVSVPGLVVLHVYALAEDRLLPVLRVPVQPAFSAETIGPGLWLYEPISAHLQASSHYEWDGTKLTLEERRDVGVGVLPPTGQEPGPPDPAAAEPGAVPARPTALPPKQSVPRPPAASPRALRPSSEPSAPAVIPEPKR
ncbi:hypothetical protein ACFRMQ_35070 [Kitasatospora sp. NPDC056783]|uniref:hypothetical protein n=1 Tax=Kitasatospora sp. NPDC056783 TaxID=3345943 RepID=UPI0036A7C805